jgi:acyl carrier protein
MEEWGLICLHSIAPWVEADRVDKERIVIELAQIIRDVVNQPELAVSEQTSAAQVTGWDSFCQIHIAVAAEAHFGIKFRTAEFETFATVGAMACLIGEKLDRKP